jgi:hypothetical protein
MPTYRAYIIDRDDRVASYKPIEAETDAEALEAARQFVDDCRASLWTTVMWRSGISIGRSGGLNARKGKKWFQCFCMLSCQSEMKTPPASEDADGVFHAFTPLEVAALGKVNFETPFSFRL